MTVGNRLTDMEFDEISLVTRPANQLSKVILFKSDTQEQEDMETPESATEPVAEETVEEESVDKGMGMGAYGKKRKKMPMMDMEDDDEEMMGKMGYGGKKMKKDDAADVIDLPAEVYEYIEALEAANAELTEQIDKAFAEAEADQGEDEILKSADPQIVAIVKAAQERAEAAEMIAKAERDFRLEREFISKAAEYRNLPVEADSFGKVLKSAAERLDSEVFEALTTVLNAANEMLSNTTMFAEVGKSVGFDNDGPTSEINKAAAQIMDKNPGMSREQAIAKAVETNPALYNSYLRGN